MHFRQRLREIAVALVGDDDRRAGLRDEEIRAGDADVGGEKFLAQYLARLGQQLHRLGEVAIRRQMRMHAAEIGLDLLLGQVDGGANDMRRNLAAQLDDIFAEIGLDGPDAGGLQRVVEGDLFRDHRLAFGDGFRAALACDVEHDLARFRRVARVMHVAAGFRHLLLVGFEIEVEMRERVVLDVARGIAQRLEFRQMRDGRPRGVPGSRRADVAIASCNCGSAERRDARSP